MSDLTLGTRLRQHREILGFTIAQVNFLTGIDSAFIAMLEADKIDKPAPYILSLLACFYKIKVIDLLGDECEEDPLKEAALAFVKWRLINKHMQDEVVITQGQINLLLDYFNSAGTKG